MDLETFTWLLTEDGQRLLVRAGEGDDSLATATALRREASPERVAAAMGVVEMRRRGRDKLGEDADRLYLTREALEQATRAPVARHRAARSAAYAPSSMLDLTCSVGGDLIAFARAGLTVAGIDLDPVRAAMARANLEALGLPGAVSVADATTLDLAPFGMVFADPARRTGAGRTFDVDAWQPSWDAVSTWLTSRPACAKVAPGIPHDLVPAGAEAEWVSDRGDLVEASLWSAPLATAARRATVIGHGGLASLTDEDDPGAAQVGVGEIGSHLHEPDDAVIRAGLVTAVAAIVGGHLVDPHLAYVTGDDPVRTPFARSYAVLEELPYREKQLRAALRERGIGRLTIKKRGVDVVPEQLRARLALRGDEEGTIVLTRTPAGARALLVRPL